MAAHFIVSATVAAGFYRCGRHFTQAGVLIEASEFTEEQWERIKNEIRLRVAPATDEAKDAISDRAARIAEAIKSELKAEDYQRDGKPRVDTLNTLLGDELGKITANERDNAWDTLIENDFKAPATGA